MRIKNDDIVKYIFCALRFMGAQKAIAQRPTSPIPIPPPALNLVPGGKASVVTDIWIVSKTHSDLGCTMSIKAVLKKYREDMMDRAPHLIDEDGTRPFDANRKLKQCEKKD